MSNPERSWKVWLAPGESLDIGSDWSAWLTDADTVASVAVVAEGCTVSAPTYDTTRTVYRISGGTASMPATVTETMTTAGGEVAIAVHGVTVG